MENVKHLFEQASLCPEGMVIEDSEPNYWAISNTDGILRWIFPKNPQIGLRALRQWHPFNPISRLKWSVLLTAYQFGFLGNLPGVRPVCLKEIDWPGGLCSPVFYVGTPSRVRKMVITLFHPNDPKSVSLLKTPLAENAARNILHEADILKMLSPWELGICPGLQAVMPERGQSLQDIIHGHTAGFDLTPSHFQLLEDLRAEGASTSLTEQSGLLFEKIQTFPLLETEKWILPSIRETLQDDAVLPAFKYHGDFSPWNVIEGESRLHLIDWERSQMRGLPLLDLYHFLTMQCLIKNKPPLFSLGEHPAIGRHLKRIGHVFPGSVIRKILLYYFLEQWLNACNEGTAHSREIALHDLKNCWKTML